MVKQHQINLCCICGKPIIGNPHNARPISDKGQCCESCFKSVVMPTRQRKYNVKHKLWEEQNSKRYSFRINIVNNKDIYEKLESVDSVADYIRQLILADIHK